MTKKFDIGLSKKPKIPLKGKLDGFSLITEDNRKQAIVIGRIIYTIKQTIVKKELRNELLGFYTIYPLFRKGWNKIQYYPWDLTHPYWNGTNYWKVYYDADGDYNLWATNYKWLIDKGILAKNIFIRPVDPILQFLKEK